MQHWPSRLLNPWEDRFGARLLEVGLDDVKLLVERPPRTLQAAQRIAAEQWRSPTSAPVRDRLG
jgi:hypothetical protein